MAATSFARAGYVNAQNGFTPVNFRAQDVAATTGETAEAHITNADIHLTSAQAAAIEGAIQGTALGAANGVATLDANQKLTASQLPNSVQGGMSYQGTFDPTAGRDGNGITIPEASAANKGFYWIAEAAGSWTPPGNSTAIDFAIGDWLVSNGTDYDEIDNTTVDQTARTAAQNAQTAAENAQEAADNAQETASGANDNAAAALTEAQLLDAAYCADETDMAGKNLRVGALVLMAVTNTSVDTPEA